jgi:hypothetical protein
VIEVSSRARRLVRFIAIGLAVLGAVGAARAIAPAFSASASWQRADVTADWVVTKGAWSGRDPYGNTAALAHELGTTIADRADTGGAATEAPHPRPPGAMIALAPLALFGARQAYAVSAVVNLVLLGVIALLTARAIKRPLWWAVLGVGVALNATAARDALNWGTLSYVMATLLLGTYVASKAGDRARAGIPLGVAAALKLFPLALVIPLVLYGRRRVGTGALVTFAALTVGGLCLPAVHVAGAIHALAGAGGAWVGSPGNASVAAAAVRFGVSPSLATVVGLAFGALAVWFVVRRSPDWRGAYWAMALVALCVSPISWRHYDVMVVVGAVLIALDGRHRVAQVTIGAWLVVGFAVSGVFVASSSSSHYGAWGLLARVVLLAGYWLAFRAQPPLGGAEMNFFVAEFGPARLDEEGDQPAARVDLARL